MKSNKPRWILAVAMTGMSVFILGGCATMAPHAGETMSAVQPEPYQPPHLYRTETPAEGSLYTDNGAFLFVDYKARQVGDTVTIDIVENSSSKMDANTSASRENTIDAGVSHLFGYMRALEGMNPNLNRTQGNSLTNKLIQASMENEFEGQGSSDRSGRVTASIGARVVEVLPGGNLFIQGERQTKVNNEVLFIRVSGIVRPSDITQDNRIQSTYLADARIEYFGRGVLADKQKPGWATRVLDHVWPF